MAASPAKKALTCGTLPSTLEALNDDLLLRVVLHLECVEDLLRLARVGRRYRAFVGGAAAEAAWEHLYSLLPPPARTQGGATAAVPAAAAAAAHPPAAAAAAVAETGVGSSRGGGGAAGVALRLPLPLPRGGVVVPPGGSGCSAGGTPAGPAAPARSMTWKEQFKQRYLEERQRLALQRRARLMKAQSTQQVLSQQVHSLRAAMQQEQHTLAGLEAQLAELQQARAAAAAAASAQLAAAYWQPVAVQQAHARVTDQEPVGAEQREHALQQSLAVSRLEQRKLAAAVRAQQQRLADAQRRVQALQP